MARGLRIAFILLLAVVSALPAAVQAAHEGSGRAATIASKPLPALRLTVQPPSINVQRTVKLSIRVTDTAGKPVAGALISVLNTGSPQLGRAPHGVLTVMVHSDILGSAQVSASRAGYAPVSLKIPIVPGPPASVAAVKRGIVVLAPHAKPLQGAVGTNLFELYHALTGAKQFASLSLRDGTLMDLNTNTDVVIHDPLHTTVNAGELFLEVVHGSASHQVQVGTAVAATKGTRLDVRVDPKTKAAVIAVVEGQVLVSNSKVGGAILVGANQQTTVAVGRPPSPPKPVDLSKLLAWVANLPNTNTSTVPPVLNLPAPIVTAAPLPPVAASPAITVTGALTASTTFTAANGPYLVNGTLSVPAGLSLTIAAGTVLEMGPGASIFVRGTFTARGTQTAPILITSAAPQPTPGAWSGLQLDSPGASASVLDHVQMFYGGVNTSGMLSITNQANPTITNSVFAQSTTSGLYIDGGSRPVVTNCVFAGDAGPAINTPADDVGQLTGIGYGPNQPGISAQGDSLTHAASWQRPDVPITIIGTLTIPAGTTLTIAPGTVLEMGPGASIFVRGTFTARGTQTAPILITSAAPQPTPGAWSGLQLDSPGASASVLDHVQMFYGGVNTSGMLSITGQANPTITNSVFAQSTTSGLYIDGGSRPVVTNCVFAGDAGPAINTPADDVGQLTGIGYGPNQPGISAQGDSLTHAASWQRPDVPITIIGTLTIPADITLTIAPGTVLTMGPGASIFVRGIFTARGTQTAPILITSASPKPTPGDWSGLQLDSSSASQSVLDHVQMFYGGVNTSGMLSITNQANISVTNSVFAQSTTSGLYIDGGSRPVVTNCVFAGDAGPAINTPTDDVGQLTDIGYGANQAGISAQGDSLTHAASWQRPDVPITIIGTLTIPADITLTIAPGTVLTMGPGASIFVRGILTARGTQAEPIFITSASPKPTPGGWSGIQIDSPSASASVLDYVQMLYGGANTNGMLSITGQASISVTNSVFAYSLTVGIYVAISQQTIAHCTFQGNKGPAISVPAADPKHIHDNIFVGGQQGVKVQ